MGLNYSFQEPVTPIMYGILSLHDHILFFLSLILFIVVYILISTLNEFYYTFKFIPEGVDEDGNVVDLNNSSYQNGVSKVMTYNNTRRSEVRKRIWDGRIKEFYGNKSFSYVWSKLNNGISVEIIWTIIPSFILLLIAIPSFALLFAIDEINLSKIVVKVIGHQWYWSYELTGLTKYNALSVASFDSYMLPDSDLIKGDLRLLKTDNALILPKNLSVLVIITSDDVLHSWAVPAFGVKVDAVPGRLSQISLLLKSNGIFNGQCSELCGVNHGFMPIEVWVIDAATFFKLEMFMNESLLLKAVKMTRTYDYW